MLIFTLPYRTNAVAVFLYGNDQRNHTGICNWRGNGEAVPCQILGFQQSEIGI